MHVQRCESASDQGRDCSQVSRDTFSNPESSHENRIIVSLSLSSRRRESEDRKNAWDAFVESIRSKLTVQQVVDGVRSGGDLTFDYVLLVLTAE